MKQEAMLGGAVKSNQGSTAGCHGARNGGPSPTGHRQLNPTNYHVNLGAGGSPEELLDERLALADTLIAASGQILKQRTRLSCAQIL